MREKPEIFIYCDCHCCGVQVSQFNEIDELFFITFWIAEWYAIPSSIFSIVWQRIKLAFKVLFNGDYFLKELVLSRDNFKKLKDYLNSVE
jgi:hypothetical protein